MQPQIKNTTANGKQAPNRPRTMVVELVKVTHRGIGGKPGVLVRIPSEGQANAGRAEAHYLGKRNPIDATKPSFMTTDDYARLTDAQKVDLLMPYQEVNGDEVERKAAMHNATMKVLEGSSNQGAELAALKAEVAALKAAKGKA